VSPGEVTGGRSASSFIAWVGLLFLLLPIFVVIPVSFTPNRYLSLPTDDWSLRHYTAIVTEPLWRKSVIDSLIVASGATVIAVLLGTICAVGCWRISSRLSEFVRFLMLAPIIVPSIVHALGFYQAWAEVGLLDTYTGLIIAHAMKGLPYVVISVSASLANFDLRLEQAARNLGATVTGALWRVVVPCIRPGILAGAVFAFITSWDELVVTMFITARRVYTLPKKIWDGIQDNISPSVAAMATVLIAVTLVAVILHLLHTRKHLPS
jgi:putative spermidine/putrescine transport system permease protein